MLQIGVVRLKITLIAAGVARAPPQPSMSLGEVHTFKGCAPHSPNAARAAHAHPFSASAKLADPVQHFPTILIHM